MMNFVATLVYTLLLISMLASCGNSSSGSTTAALEAPATASEPSLSFATKTFRFSWTDVDNATHYKLLENPDGNSGFTQVGGDISQGTQSTDHIVPLYARINAQYILQSCNDAGCTDSSTLSVSGSLSDAIGYFKAGNAGANDQFGRVVRLSADGSTLAVSAWHESSSTTGINSTPDDTAANAGAVYVYILSNGSWVQQAYIKASNTGANDEFGFSLSLSTNGDTLAVGAYLEDSSSTGINSTSNNLADQAGAVYVYRRSGNSWSEQAYIKSSNAPAGDQFGRSVSLSGDGNTLAVGSVGDDSNTSGIDSTYTYDITTQNNGAVYMFGYNGSAWSQQAYIKASNPSPGDSFGNSVSLSTDGTILAVGAEYENSSTTGINSTPDDAAPGAGAVYIYGLSGSTWSEQDYIKASNAQASDHFGFSVSLSGDGNTLAVAAYQEDSSTTGINSVPDEAASAAGAAYVFSHNGGSWSEEAYIKASNVTTLDYFGIDVSLSTDGNTLAVGALFEDGSGTGINSVADETADAAGAAFVYQRSGSTWSELAYIKARNTEAGDWFGFSVSLSGDGHILAVGAQKEDSSTTGIDSTPDEAAIEAGAVYVY